MHQIILNPSSCWGGGDSGEIAELSLSLDVIYHLIEDNIFEDYMNTLFASANSYVIIYSSNTENNKGFENTHVKHREFTHWIDENIIDWELKKHIPNKYPYEVDYLTGTWANFYFYEKILKCF